MSGKLTLTLAHPSISRCQSSQRTLDTHIHIQGVPSLLQVLVVYTHGLQALTLQELSRLRERRTHESKNPPISAGKSSSARSLLILAQSSFPSYPSREGNVVSVSSAAVDFFLSSQRPAKIYHVNRSISRYNPTLFPVPWRSSYMRRNPCIEARGGANEHKRSLDAKIAHYWAGFEPKRNDIKACPTPGPETSFSLSILPRVRLTDQALLAIGSWDCQAKSEERGQWFSLVEASALPKLCALRRGSCATLTVSLRVTTSVPPGAP